MIERVKEKLAGKKVLFIACKFYHYGEAIYDKIKSYGADVTFYYERDTSFNHVIAANFFPDSLDKRQDTHYNKILKETSDQTFDILIVIRGYKMRGWFMDEIKNRNPNIHTILYQWDSVKFWDSDYRYLIPYFNKTLSFDYIDCADLKLPYAPTFHMDEYSEIKEIPQKFDFIFCSNHTDEKYRFLLNFLKFASEKGYKVKVHLYMSWFKYLKEKLKTNKIDYNLISFRRLKRDEYFKLFCESRTIVDFSSTAQSGISMRVIDALGCGKKVLTNNSYVKNEPGYNPQQVTLYDTTNLNFSDSIITDEKFEKTDYSIDKWLENIFYAN
jgi:hypothetical protein